MSGRDAPSEHARGQGAHQNRGTSEPQMRRSICNRTRPKGTSEQGPEQNTDQNSNQNRTATRTATRTPEASQTRTRSSAARTQQFGKPEPELRQPEHRSSPQRNQNIGKPNIRIRPSELQSSAHRNSKFGWPKPWFREGTPNRTPAKGSLAFPALKILLGNSYGFRGLEAFPTARKWTRLGL